MRKTSPSTGRLDPAAARKNALIERTIEFLWNSLLPWRDDPERPQADGEEELNGFFCDFLTARASDLCPMIFFRHEQRQEGQRRVDMAAKPKRTVVIRGMTYTKYKPILVIEGKRLPAPSKPREREYVSGGEERTGGIQRFKLGLHGKDHETAILLGYIQTGMPKEWHSRVNSWLEAFASKDPGTWTKEEMLKPLTPESSKGRSRSTSSHARVAGCRTAKIHLHHFWVCLRA